MLDKIDPDSKWVRLFDSLVGPYLHALGMYAHPLRCLAARFRTEHRCRQGFPEPRDPGRFLHKPGAQFFGQVVCRLAHFLSRDQNPNRNNTDH